ncbi:hypothetical protein D3C85_684710 [compost metagenome]
MIHGEGRDPTFAHHLHFALDGLFDVLWIQVVAAHNQHVFQAPGDEQFAIAQEAQISGAQPSAPRMLDKGLRRGFGVTPVPMGDTRPGRPDFADLLVSQFRQRLGVDDQHRVFRLAVAATHDGATLARFGTVLRQRLLIQTQRRDTLAARTACYEQRGLGQPV